MTTASGIILYLVGYELDIFILDTSQSLLTQLDKSYLWCTDLVLEYRFSDMWNRCLLHLSGKLFKKKQFLQKGLYLSGLDLERLPSSLPPLLPLLRFLDLRDNRSNNKKPQIPEVKNSIFSTIITTGWPACQDHLPSTPHLRSSQFLGNLFESFQTYHIYTLKKSHKIS